MVLSPKYYEVAVVAFSGYLGMKSELLLNYYY